MVRKLGFPQPFCMVRRLPIDNLTLSVTYNGFKYGVRLELMKFSASVACKHSGT